jgi:hypothetical protein
MKFVVCVSREGFGEFSANDLTLGRLYEVVEVKETTAARLHELLAAA